MPTFTPPRMHVVRKEEKEARLTAFVAEQLAVAIACNAHGRDMTVLALSFDSPVLKAVAAQAAAIRAAGLRVRVIAVLAEGASDVVTSLLAGVDVRSACDGRLLDAHEQLAVGDKVAWIGDCMRREPTKRDAYEIYSADCAESAALAHRSFDRVWSFAGQERPDAVVTQPKIVAAVVPVDVSLVAIADGETAPTVSTRH